MSGVTSQHIWIPPANVRAAGESARVRFAAAAATADGEQRAPSAALVALRDIVVRRVRGITSGGMVRPSNRRAGASRDPHRAGIAIDFMVRNDSTRAAVGDALANALVLGAERLDVQYVLWSGLEWSASSSGARWERYTGSDPHRDHVHMELGPDARVWSSATMRTTAESALVLGAQPGALVGLLGPWLVAVGVSLVWG